MFLLLFNYVQVMVRGCPLGFTSAFDNNAGLDHVKGCQTGTDCPVGADCLFSPVSPVYVCCRHDLDLTTNAPMYDYESTIIVNGIELKNATAPQSIVVSIENDSPTESENSAAINLNASKPTPNGPGFSSNILIPLPGVWSRLPDVRPILVGRILSLRGRPNVSQRYGSVTLIRDSGYNILVDTGSAPRQNDIKAALAALGVTPVQIQMVILTHGHPDHFGNTQLFPLSQFLYGNYLFKGEEFLSYGLNQAQIIKLTDNVDVWSTPGHTPDSVTVVVRNVPYGGVVAITGDLFTSEDDLEDSRAWTNFSSNINQQQDSRNFVICRVNWIIPGHDKMFKVSNSTRLQAGCSNQTPEPLILFPKLPQQTTYEEQNAIRYAYFAYASRDTLPTHSDSSPHPPRASQLVMNDQSSLNSISPSINQRSQLQSIVVGGLQHHQQQMPVVLGQREVPGHLNPLLVNQNKPQHLSFIQQQQPIPSSSSSGACCIFVENQAPKKIPDRPPHPATWQQPYHLTYGQQGISYRSGKN